MKFHGGSYSCTRDFFLSLSLSAKKSRSVRFLYPSLLFTFLVLPWMYLARASPSLPSQWQFVERAAKIYNSLYARRGKIRARESKRRGGSFVPRPLRRARTSGAVWRTTRRSGIATRERSRRRSVLLNAEQELSGMQQGLLALTLSQCCGERLSS